MFEAGEHVVTFLGQGRKVRADRGDGRAISVVKSHSASHPQLTAGWWWVSVVSEGEKERVTGGCEEEVTGLPSQLFFPVLLLFFS